MTFFFRDFKPHFLLADRAKSLGLLAVSNIIFAYLLATMRFKEESGHFGVFLRSQDPHGNSFDQAHYDVITIFYYHTGGGQGTFELNTPMPVAASLVVATLLKRGIPITPVKQTSAPACGIAKERPKPIPPEESEAKEVWRELESLISFGEAYEAVEFYLADGGPESVMMREQTRTALVQHYVNQA